MVLGRQVQQPIGGMQVGPSPSPIRDAPDHHVAKDGAKRALMAGLPVVARDAGGVDHRVGAGLMVGPCIEMALKGEAQQFPALGLQP